MLAHQGARALMDLIIDLVAVSVVVAGIHHLGDKWLAIDREPIGALGDGLPWAGEVALDVRPTFAFIHDQVSEGRRAECVLGGEDLVVEQQRRDHRDRRNLEYLEGMGCLLYTSD